MKIAVMDARRTRVNIEIRQAVNYRNMHVLAKYLKADELYDIVDLYKNKDKKYDCVIVGFAAPSVEYNISKKILRNAKLIVWFISEYEQSFYNPLAYVKNKLDVIKNYEGQYRQSYKDRVKNIYDININLLQANKPNNKVKKKYNCIYYGRWREDRADYFKKYLQDNIYLSTSKKNMKKYKHIGCNPKYIDKLRWTPRRETLNYFKYSLYIEDKFTHKVFNNLANRYYEAGNCNVVTLFDKNCWNTIKKSELNEKEVEKYIVSDYNDLQGKIKELNKDYDKYQNEQISWHKSDLAGKDKVLKQIKDIVCLDQKQK